LAAQLGGSDRPDEEITFFLSKHANRRDTMDDPLIKGPAHHER
jgi:hypothetical protein